MFVETASEEFNNSQRMTNDNQNQILGKEKIENPATKYQITKERSDRQKEKLDYLIQSMAPDKKKSTLANGQKGVSNWLGCFCNFLILYNEPRFSGFRMVAKQWTFNT
eukprot:TCONS_00072038-protein